MAKNVNNLTLKFNPDQERARRHSGQFSSPSVMDPELPHFLAVTGSHRSRSGSFNPTILTTSKLRSSYNLQESPIFHVLRDNQSSG